jgi:hypothetical protein
VVLGKARLREGAERLRRDDVFERARLPAAPQAVAAIKTPASDLRIFSLADPRCPYEPVLTLIAISSVSQMQEFLRN